MQQIIKKSVAKLKREEMEARSLNSYYNNHNILTMVNACTSTNEQLSDGYKPHNLTDIASSNNQATSDSIYMIIG